VIGGVEVVGHLVLKEAVHALEDGCELLHGADPGDRARGPGQGKRLGTRHDHSRDPLDMPTMSPAEVAHAVQGSVVVAG
jgi:hypothetical protein